MKLKYKAVLTIILAAFLFQGGCDLFKKYDIQGSWTFVKIVDGVEITFSATFAEYPGYRDTGQVTVDENTYGSYVIEFETDLTIEIFYFEPGALETGRKDTFKGGFDSKITMSGDVEEVDVAQGLTKTGTWTAVKENQIDGF